MIKKAFIGFLVFSGIWAFSSFAADTNVQKVPQDVNKSGSLESVNIFNQRYYGTLTRASSDAVFTSLPSPEENSFQMEGNWEGDSFKGDCTITWEDGSVYSVKYKKGIITGLVSVLNPDGSRETFSSTSGTPYKQRNYYDKNGTLTDTDWYYLGTLQSTWLKSALSLSYADLTETPYEYVDFPVELSGTVQAIYEAPRYSYLKIADSENHIYLCRNINLRMDKYAPARIRNLSVGDHVTICGKYLGLTDPAKKPLPLFEHTLGYEIPFEKFQSSIVDSEFFNTYRPYGIVSDKELEVPVPELSVICCETDRETADPAHLTGEYEEICEYPFYYMDQDMKLDGTVIYENFDANAEQAVFLVRQKDSDNIYAVTWKTAQYTSLLNKKITCTGYLNGNNKISYLNPETKALGYALYPNISVEKVSEQE